MEKRSTKLRLHVFQMGGERRQLAERYICIIGNTGLLLG